MRVGYITVVEQLVIVISLYLHRCAHKIWSVIIVHLMHCKGK